MPVLRTGQDYKSKLDEERLDVATDEPNLPLIRKAIEDTQSDASDYYNRNQYAFNWWHSRWYGQTIDGLKWNTRDDSGRAWPWEGASDTRVNLINQVSEQFLTIQMYAALNMKIQAKSFRPFMAGETAGKANTLMNWMLFTKMIKDLYRELQLLLNWRNVYGAAILCVEWDQERQIEFVPISVMSVQALLSMQAKQQIPLDYVQGILSDPEQEGTIIRTIQAASPIVTTSMAKRILNDLRQMRTAQIPIPYVLRSQPRWTALRPMVDITFPSAADDAQRCRWFDRTEWVTESELTDRIETAGYDEDFVEQALQHKGPPWQEPWASRSYLSRNLFGQYNFGYYNDALHDFDDKIELHHFYTKAVRYGTPTLYKTVFHMDVEISATHGPDEYQHGEYPFHFYRFENHERPLLSSRGIAEQAYTWEMEIKKQRDGRTDLTDLALRPPIFAPHQDVLRIKQAFCPGVVWPERRANELRLMQPPPVNQSSIEIENSVREMVREYFFSNDPDIKKLRNQQLADTFLIELKPAVAQTWQIIQQYIPDSDVQHVLGRSKGPPPIHLGRAAIQGQYDITMTVDLRDLDNEFIKQKMNAIRELMSWDKAGTINATPIIKRAFEAIDYTLADEALQSQDSVTNKEMQDEHDALSKILGSGLDQPLPPGANHSLRLQVLQNTVQQNMQQNPAFQKIIQGNPDLMKLIQNRIKFHKNQIQQQENAKIGRIQTTQTFSKSAPEMALPMGGGQ